MFCVLLISGCASQGPLRPPSLKLPSAITRLSAERAGSVVDLHWTTPSKTTDGVLLAGKHGAGALSAEICRGESASGSCTAPAHIGVTAGAPGEFRDTLPASLLDGSLRPLYYRVRILNGEHRGAKYAEVDTLAGAAPPVVSGLAAEPAANGVRLHWLPDSAAGGAQTVLQVERVPSSTDQQTAGGTRSHMDLLSVAPAARDPGGAIDTAAKPGVEQRYTVFRTQTLRLGDKVLTASSLPVTVIVSAAAKAPPPPPPVGLEALVNTLGAPEIDLVWQPAEGAAGYLVFRAEGDSAPVQLTPRPITGLSYADTAVRVGVRYRYAVASVNTSGLGGSLSTELIESIHQP